MPPAQGNTVLERLAIDKEVPDVQREWLAERVAEVVLALHEGNIIAWAVDRETWQRYATRVQR